MNHEKAFELMMDALDDALTPAGRQELENHLLICSDCYAEWQSLQFVDNLFTSSPTVQAPAGFIQRFKLRLAHSPQKKKLGALFALSIGSVTLLATVAIPSVFMLLGILVAFAHPSSFADWMVWLNQLFGVSGSLFDVLWTTIRLLLGEIGANPLAISWTLAAALAVGLLAHMTRHSAPIPVENGNKKKYL
jgi:hypothetical protein